MRKEHSKEGYRSFIFGLIAIISFPILIPLGGAVLFPIFICGPTAIALGAKAYRKKDSLGLVGLSWGAVALCVALLMLWAILIT